ncbi:MAG: cobalt-precorrin-5B (C(1))-methyltransferase [Rhodospirillaceae bacterium]|nr:cobalt-precorrin-5B (C(1))-methyltransferase [Rhodospirillaceae bacterium]
MTRNTQGRPGTGELRKGYTTGACATAATAACAEALLTGHFPDPVTISLPRGASVAFSLAESSIEDNSASAGIIKDAGDDPDVTHGALIRVTLRRGALGKGITFYAGEGVGTVTRPGLALSPGEAAINPVPREMMTNAVSEIAAHHGAQADFEITVSVPGGEKLAEKTLNGRLGIIGGLSILGTTGIVVPYSCSAWVHAIHRGIDVARAGGETHLVAATGRTSEPTVSEASSPNSSRAASMTSSRRATTSGCSSTTSSRSPTSASRSYRRTRSTFHLRTWSFHRPTRTASMLPPRI